MKKTINTKLPSPELLLKDSQLQLQFVASSLSHQLITQPRLAHSHKNICEIQYLYGGTGKYKVNGRMYDIHPGDVFLVNRNILHEDQPQENHGMNLLCAGFKGLHLPGLDENMLLQNDQIPILNAGRYGNEFYRILQGLFELGLDHSQYTREISNHLLEALVILTMKLIRESPVMLEPEITKSEEISLIVQKYIEDNYHEDLTLGDISSAVNLSPYYMAHIFKDIIGCSPVQYVTRRRLGEAQTFLIHTTKSITEIASLCGYENPSNFNVIFSKYAGESPKKYRSSYVGISTAIWAEDVKNDDDVFS